MALAIGSRRPGALRRAAWVMATCLPLGTVPAAGQYSRADPTIPGGLLVRVPHSIASLPRALEGFYLGESLGEVVARLRRDGWTVRQYHGRRRGHAYTRLNAGWRRRRAWRHRFRRRWRRLRIPGYHRASRRRPGHLRRLKMTFSGGRLVTVRVYFRPSSRNRGLALATLCAGRERAAPSRHTIRCLDPPRTTLWSVRKNGSRAELVDLAALLRAGLITRRDVEGRLRRTASGPVAVVP